MHYECLDLFTIVPRLYPPIIYRHLSCFTANFMISSFLMFLFSLFSVDFLSLLMNKEHNFYEQDMNALNCKLDN